MSSPLQPGSRLGNGLIEGVLSWGRRGGLYRLVAEAGPHLLKEVALPPLAAAPQQQRLQQCLEAIDGWRALRLPQAIAITEVVASEDRFYLVLPELPAEPVSREAPSRPAPARPAELLRWAEQICELVLALLRHQHPLALTVMEPDHMLVDAGGGLVVFNPGWSELAWRGAEELREIPVQQGLRKFAELMVFLASGSAPGETLPEQLPPTLLWIIARCLSQDRSRHYASFQELRQALLALPIHSQPAGRTKVEPLEDFPLSELPSPPPSRPLPIWLRRLLAAVASVAMVGLALALRPGGSDQAKPSPGLALARGDRLELLTPEGKNQGEIRLKGAIRCLAASASGEQIYLGVRGESGLTVVERPSLSVQQLPGSQVPTQLLVSSDGLELAALLQNGNVGRWKLGTGAPRWQGEISLDQSGPRAILTVPSNGEVLLLQPGQGLVLVDSQSEGPWARWNHSGANSALAVEGLVVTVDSSERTLYALSRDLQPISRRELPGGSGLTQLHRDSYRRRFWALHQGGRVTLWAVPELAQIGDVQLPSPPGCACPDPFGCLWILAQDGSLLKLASSPPSWQRMGRVEPAHASAMVYLALPAPKTPAPREGFQGH